MNANTYVGVKDVDIAIARGNNLHTQEASEKEPLERWMAIQIGTRANADASLPCPKQSS
jgi:hypothetical protein